MRKGWRALNLILMLAAALLVLATTGALAARHWWVFDLFSHFRLQYVIAAGVLCLAALAIRAYPAAAVLAAVALFHGWTIKDLWLGGTAAAAPGGTPLRVLSANVWNDNRTPERVLELVRTSDADLVVLVDARRKSWRPVLTELGTRYPYATRQSWRNGRAPVILFSRFPILSETVMQAPRGRRPYLVAKLDVDGETLVVVGVHSSSPRLTGAGHSRRRNRELDHIAAALSDADGPVIATGDFNVTPWSPHFRDLLAAGMDVMRINCARDNPDAWAAMVDNLRRAQRELGRSCKILTDLGGPKLRTGAIQSAGRILRIKPTRDVRGRVVTPARVWLTPAEIPQDGPGDATATLLAPRELLEKAEPGDELRFRDARDKKRKLRIVSCAGESRLAETDKTAYIEDGLPVTLHRRAERLGAARFSHLPVVTAPLELAA